MYSNVCGCVAHSWAVSADGCLLIGWGWCEIRAKSVRLKSNIRALWPVVKVITGVVTHRKQKKELHFACCLRTIVVWNDVLATETDGVQGSRDCSCCCEWSLYTVTCLWLKVLSSSQWWCIYSMEKPFVAKAPKKTIDHVEDVKYLALKQGSETAGLQDNVIKPPTCLWFNICKYLDFSLKHPLGLC